MLLRVAMPFRADYVPKGGRIARHAWFVEDETVEIAESSATEVREAFRLVSGPGREPTGRDSSDRDRRILAHDGRLYWPVLDGDRPVHVPTWATGLRRGGPAPLPDVFGFEKSLRGRDWPLQRFDPGAVRSVVESGRDEAAARLHREAARLLLADGWLYRRGGEPVWLVRADIRRFDAVGQAVFRDAMDVWEPVTAQSAFDSPVPFVNYERFRADRGGDAEDFARRRIAADRKGCGYYGEDDRWRIEAAVGPDADVLTPMLRGLHDCTVGLVSWGADWTRRDLGLAAETPDDEIASAHGPGWLRCLAGMEPAPEGASACVLARRLSEAAGRLAGADTRVDVFGWVETVRLALVRAGERADHDFGQGLVPPADEDRQDDDALAALAGE